MQNLSISRIIRHLSRRGRKWISTKPSKEGWFFLGGMTHDAQRDGVRQILEFAKSEDEKTETRIKYEKDKKDSEKEIINEQWRGISATDKKGRGLFKMLIPANLLSKDDRSREQITSGDRSITGYQEYLYRIVSEALGNRSNNFNPNSKISLDVEKILPSAENTENVMLEKYKKYAEQDSSLREGNRRDTMEVAIISNLETCLDLKEKSLSIKNFNEIKDDFVKSGLQESDFHNIVNRFVGTVLGHFTKVGHKQVEHLGRQWQRNKGNATEYLQRSEGKIYSATAETREKATSDNRLHLVSPPFRQDDILNLSGLFGTSDELADSGLNFASMVAKSLVVNAYFEYVAKAAYGDENFHKHFKQMNLSPVKGAVIFQRDYSIFYNNAFHQTDSRIVAAIAEEERSSSSFNIFQKRYFPTSMDRINSHRSDMNDSGFNVEQDIPFDAKGGNMIITTNADGRRVLLATVSDLYFRDNGRFKGGYVIEDNEVVKKSHNQYDWFCKQLRDWGESIGCDEIIVLDRNIQANDEEKFKELYHLDVFCGELPGGYVVINHDAVTKENMIQLKQVFGEDKIIPLSQEEQDKLCANFIVFNRMVMMSSPETPQSFIDKMKNLGFDVFVPPVELTIAQTKDRGWLAGVRCMSNSTDGSEREVVSHEEINVEIKGGADGDVRGTLEKPTASQLCPTPNSPHLA